MSATDPSASPPLEFPPPPREVLDAHLDATFTTFCEANYLRVHRFLSGLCADRDLVEDVVQDTFLITRAAWYKIHEYDLPLAWVYHAARTVLRKHLSKRRQERDREQVRDEDIDEVCAFVEPQNPEEAKETLTGLLNRIPLRQAEVFLLGYDGLEQLEIAQTLGIARNTVRTYKYEARRRLQRLIGQDRERQQREDRKWE